jgi:hypothetical protein
MPPNSNTLVLLSNAIQFPHSWIKTPTYNSIHNSELIQPNKFSTNIPKSKCKNQTCYIVTITKILS